ncbi:MAG: hypothetical protein ACPF8V_07535 [Luteibaculum sp.]
MNYRQFLFALVFLPSLGFGQDLIVTEKNDSIPCKILFVNTQRIVFSYEFGSTRKTDNLALKKVHTYKMNFYKEGERVPPLSPKLMISQISFQGLMITGGYGLGKLTRRKDDNLSPDGEKYFRDITTGRNFSLGMKYYFSPSFGLFLHHSNFRSNASISFPVLLENGTQGTFSIDEDIRLKSTNIGGATCIVVGETAFIELQGGISITKYLNDGSVRQGSNYADFMESSSAVGVFLGLNPHIRISDKIFGVLSARYISTAIDEIDWNASGPGGSASGTEKLANPLDFNRFEFNLGLSFNLQ